MVVGVIVLLLARHRRTSAVIIHHVGMRWPVRRVNRRHGVVIVIPPTVTNVNATIRMGRILGLGRLDFNQLVTHFETANAKAVCATTFGIVVFLVVPAQNVRRNGRIFKGYKAEATRAVSPAVKHDNTVQDGTKSFEKGAKLLVRDCLEQKERANTKCVRGKRTQSIDYTEHSPSITCLIVCMLRYVPSEGSPPTKSLRSSFLEGGILRLTRAGCWEEASLLFLAKGEEAVLLARRPPVPCWGLELSLDSGATGAALLLVVVSLLMVLVRVVSFIMVNIETYNSTGSGTEIWDEDERESFACSINVCSSLNSSRDQD